MIRSVARCMLCAGVSWIAASTAFADGQIEIVRGTEVETHTIGSGSVGGRGPSVDVETRSYSMSPTERQRIRSCVDQVIRIYRDVLGVKVPFDFDIDLTVQGDARKYRRETRNRPILGYYRHSDREAVVSGKTNRAQVRYTAVHESSHAILMDQAPYVPAWLNEGARGVLQPDRGRWVGCAHPESVRARGSARGDHAWRRLAARDAVLDERSPVDVARPRDDAARVRAGLVARLLLHEQRIGPA
jgi:hypothetical protein